MHACSSKETKEIHKAGMKKEEGDTSSTGKDQDEKPRLAEGNEWPQHANKKASGQQVGNSEEETVLQWLNLHG